MQCGSSKEGHVGESAAKSRFAARLGEVAAGAAAVTLWKHGRPQLARGIKLVFGEVHSR